MLQKLYHLLITSRLFRVLFGVVFGYVLFSASTHFAERALVASLSRSQFFTYESVSFVERQGTYLVFASIREVKQSHPLYFNDILHCADGETFRFFSSEDVHNERPRVTDGYRRLEWSYHRPFPTGQECYLESNITMNVNGVRKHQSITSAPFTINDEPQTTTPSPATQPTESDHSGPIRTTMKALRS